jgi:hypothetical protein
VRRLAGKPLTWIVVAEAAIVVTLLAVSWHLLAGIAHTAPVPVVLPAEAALRATPAAPEIPGVLSPPSPAARLLAPGLNLDAAFWRLRLVALNAAEAQLEALEWRIVHSALDTIHRYVESVVVPDVQRAEAGGA